MRHCSTCDAYVPPPAGYDLGECRRKAPAPVVYHFADGMRARWPLTLATDGCCEWLTVETEPATYTHEIPTEVIAGQAGAGMILSEYVQITEALGLHSNAPFAQTLAAMRQLRQPADAVENRQLREEIRELEDIIKQLRAGTIPLHDKPPVRHTLPTEYLGHATPDEEE